MDLVGFSYTLTFQIMDWYTWSLENSSTLGMQLVTILIDQLDGELQLKRGPGTEFIIRITVEENS